MNIRRILVTTFALCASHAALAQDESVAAPAITTGPTLTRSEVLADLKLYRESGLADLDQAETDRSSPAYARAQAKYQELRASPQYAVLLRQLALHRGEALLPALR